MQQGRLSYQQTEDQKKSKAPIARQVGSKRQQRIALVTASPQAFPSLWVSGDEGHLCSCSCWGAEKGRKPGCVPTSLHFSPVVVKNEASCSVRALILLTWCFGRAPDALALQQVTKIVYLPATLFEPTYSTVPQGISFSFHYELASNCRLLV